MRDPSIHITKSRLLNILDAYGIMLSRELVNYIMDNARSYNLTSRTLVLTNAAGKRDSIKAQEEIEGETDAVLFNQALNNERKRKQHVFTPITKQDSSWIMLNKLALICDQMAKDFHIHKTEAYAAYVRLGINLMKKGYGLNRFAGYKDRIYELYSEETEVLKDENPEGTKALTQVYLQEAEKFYGKCPTLQPENRIHFLESRRLADILKADYESFVVSQIQGLEFTGNFPEPHQLHTGQAEHRYLSRKKVSQNFVRTIGSIDDYLTE